MKRLLLTLAILCCPVLLAAQSESSMIGRFLVFPRTADDSPLTLLLGEGKMVEIKPTSGRFSAPVKVTGMSEWVVGIPGPVDAEGNPTFETWGRCKSSGGSEQAVILFRKGKKNEDGFNMLAFDSDSKGFGKGKFLVFNATGSEVGGQIGKKKFKLPPAGRTMVKPVGDLKKNLCFSTFSVKVGGKWTPISTSSWPLSENARGLVFIYGDPKTKKFLVHAVRDFL